MNEPWPLDAQSKPVPSLPNGWPDLASVNWPVVNGNWAPIGYDGRPVAHRVKRRWPIVLGSVLAVLVVLGIVGAVVGGEKGKTTGAPETVAPTSQHVSRTTLGSRWPLTTTGGELFCDTTLSSTAVAYTDDTTGLTYSINGTAGNDGSLADITPIWRKDPNGDGLRVDIGPLIDLGLKLCGQES